MEYTPGQRVEIIWGTEALFDGDALDKPENFVFATYNKRAKTSVYGHMINFHMSNGEVEEWPMHEKEFYPVESPSLDLSDLV